MPGTDMYRNIERVENPEVCPQVGILRIEAPLYYANARFLEDQVMGLLAARASMRIIALDFKTVTDMDATAVMSLQRVIEALRAGGNDLHIVAALGRIRDQLARSGITELLGADHLHRNFAEAGPKLVAAVERVYCERTCRSFAFAECSLIPRARWCGARRAGTCRRFEWTPAWMSLGGVSDLRDIAGCCAGPCVVVFERPRRLLSGPLRGRF
ncbi:MAG: sodium-independent anion transporter [Microcoleus sp. SM1_3_4]|nr:sodium-independent anion transporter [Microcoleus sp. SM1_3_4]